MKAFRKVKVSSRELDQVQTAVAQVLVPLSKNPVVDGTLLADLDLSAGTNKIAHLLQRTPLGWFITDINGIATIYRDSWTDTTLTLIVSANCRASIWVF